MTLYCVLVLPLGPHCLCCSLNHSSCVECETFRDSYQMLVPLFANYAFQIEVCNSIQSLEIYIHKYVCVYIQWIDHSIHSPPDSECIQWNPKSPNWEKKKSLNPTSCDAGSLLWVTAAGLCLVGRANTISMPAMRVPICSSCLMTRLIDCVCLTQLLVKHGLRWLCVRMCVRACLVSDRQTGWLKWSMRAK